MRSSKLKGHFDKKLQQTKDRAQQPECAQAHHLGSSALVHWSNMICGQDSFFNPNWVFKVSLELEVRPPILLGLLGLLGFF
jgi:hypothetical protein